MGSRGRKSAADLQAEKPERTPSRSNIVIAPPRELGKQGMALWRQITHEYAIEAPGSIELLAQACSALDRAEACRGRIDDDGEAITTRAGEIKDHPLLKHELAARAFLARTLFRLGLEE